MRSTPRLLLAVAVLAVVGVGALLAVRLLAGPELRLPAGGAAQDLPGPVLLVPGYGGSTTALEVLAAELRQAGRTARVLPLPDGGTGDLRTAAAVLDAATDAALATGAPSVDVVGYSAGGVVARLLVRDRPQDVRRVVTLGSPHHGTQVAALGAAFAPESCPEGCRQLAPGSPLLEELAEGDETPDGPQWLSVWTTQDRVVTPPDSARLDGAVNVALQDVCPALQVDHAALPVDPVVQLLVLQALSTSDVVAPTAAVCR